jgi:hypothetical protein
MNRPVQDEKMPDLLTPQFKYWCAFNGTLSGMPDVGVPRMMSCKSELPVLDWKAAEAANLGFVWFTYIFFGTCKLKQNQAPVASLKM